jgi:4'-phosphopantetheinyl transferase
LALAEFEHLESVLLKRVSAAEQAQAGRYLRPADRARFLVGRAGLRVLLGRLLRCAPSAVPLETNAFGKPQLPAPAAVQFNVTHSGAWVVIALGAQPVGIDAEKIEPGFDYEAVLAHSFGAAEQAAIRQSAHPQAAFYAHWTQHEARAKAAGHGLLGRRTSDQAAEWTVLSLDVAPGYAAALAYPSSWRPVLQYRTCDVGLIG